jgi:hypothetical protein
VPGEDALIQRRPRDAGALVGAAFRLYRRFPLLFLVLASGVIVPYDLIVLAAITAGPYTTADTSLAAQLVVGFADLAMITPLISALHVHAVADVRQGRDPRLGAVAVRGLRALPVVAAATITATLGIALGLVALIVPGIILFLRWFVVAQVAAIERGGWLPALRGSRTLTDGHYGHIFAFMVLLILITGVPGGVVTLVLGDQTTGATFPVELVIHLFVASFAALTTALLYYDLVARRETGD